MNATIRKPAPLPEGPLEALTYLDTPDSLAFAADLAGASQGPKYDRAVAEIRACAASTLAVHITEWATDNGFTVTSIKCLETGIHITVDTLDADQSLMEAPVPFTHVVNASRIPEGYITVADAISTDELDY